MEHQLPLSHWAATGRKRLRTMKRRAFGSAVLFARIQFILARESPGFQWRVDG
jgi:hypothetical protein